MASWSTSRRRSSSSTAALAGAGADGLTFDVAGATIQGLVIEHFSGDGILIAFDASGDGGGGDGGSPAGDNVSSSIIEDNGSFGVEIDDDPGDNINANVISGNTAGGISIDGTLATGNTSDAEPDRHASRRHEPAWATAGPAWRWRPAPAATRSATVICRTPIRSPSTPAPASLCSSRRATSSWPTRSSERRAGHRHRWRWRDAQRPR